MARKYCDENFTAEELKEIEMLANSIEVKAARHEARERAYRRSRLYNLRSLYKRGEKLLAKIRSEQQCAL